MDQNSLTEKLKPDVLTVADIHRLIGEGVLPKATIIQFAELQRVLRHLNDGVHYAVEKAEIDQDGTLTAHLKANGKTRVFAIPPDDKIVIEKRAFDIYEDRHPITYYEKL